MKISQVLVALVVVLLRGSVSAQTATYQLDSGATITPYFSGVPSGPSEPLSGTFEWVTYGTVPGQYLFLATNIFLDSATMSLRAAVGNYDVYTSAIWPISGEARFEATISASGLLYSLAEIHPYGFAPSSYSGSVTAPEHLTFTDLYIGQYGGGATIAHLQFSATLVPEPASASVLVAGVAALAIGRRVWKFCA